MIILMVVMLILMMTSMTIVMMLIGVVVMAMVVMVMVVMVAMLMVAMLMRVFTSLAVPSLFPSPRILFFCFGFVQTIGLGRFKPVWCKYRLEVQVEHWSRSLQDSSLQLAGRLVLHDSCSSDLNVVWNNYILLKLGPA